MNVSMKLMGEINSKGTYNVSTDMTIREIVEDIAGGMKNNRYINLIQLGGPLGICIKGRDLNNTLAMYNGDMYLNSIMVFNDIFCPVDYLRFVTRFVIRELKIDNYRLRELNELVEGIANGNSSKRTLDSIWERVETHVTTRGEFLANQVFRQILSLYETEINEHILKKRCKNGICRGLMVAQCINACPAGVHIPGYVELMKADKNKEAYELMRKTNPLSLVCGKVCARPCEDRCRRGEIESSVGVRALQRFASEMALNMDDFKEDKYEDNGKSIAVVGSGPGGLTCAYYLAKTGYRVTIYEELDRPGGMLTYGVPRFRLPYEDLEKEIKTITDIGINIITNTRVGRDISLAKLERDNDAIVLATGAHVGNTICSYDYNNVHSAVDFIKQVAMDNIKSIGNEVIVVGGGDVAMDAARTSKRLGANNVSIVSLESYSEMPSSNEEKQGAIDDKIEIINEYGINDISFDGRLNVELKKCIKVFDDEYRFNPIYDESEIMNKTVDYVILAIGQKPDITYLDETFDINRGYVGVNSEYMTSKDGVFALGDVTKPSIAIEAIADGKLAATSIDYYLGGNGLFVGREIEIPERPLDITLWDIAMVEEKRREDIDGSFEEVTKTYTVDEAKIEANRCMRCDRNSIRQLLLRPRVI